jgi:hypothetical protein
VLALLLLLVAAPAAGQGQPPDLCYFPQTGFAITNPRFVDYFQQRGGVDTFGYPISREIVLLGLPSQIFQRAVFQLAPDGSVDLLNLLDDDLLPTTRLGGATVPPPDRPWWRAPRALTNRSTGIAWPRSWRATCQSTGAACRSASTPPT